MVQQCPLFMIVFYVFIQDIDINSHECLQYVWNSCQNDDGLRFQNMNGFHTVYIDAYQTEVCVKGVSGQGGHSALMGDGLQTQGTFKAEVKPTGLCPAD